MLASRSLTEHLLHGGAGFALIALALWLAPASAWALLLVPLGLLFFRGCPMCWTIGLVEIVANRRRLLQGQPVGEHCTSCRID